MTPTTANVDHRTGALADIDRIVSSGQLPALPQSAIKILELSKDPENGPAELSRPIECDPGLASQVLRFVNSSYFGFVREISSVKLATTLVGIRTIKNFTLWSAVFSLIPNPKCGAFDMRAMWQDSLRRGLFAREMAKLMGMKEAEEPFAAALLQDMAVPLLAKELPREYPQLLSERKQGAVSLSQLERARFGATHADVAAKMARHWNLPEELAEPIERHTQIEELIVQGVTRPTTLCVALSSLLPATIDSGWPEAGTFAETYDRLRGDKGPSVLEMLTKIDRDFVEFAPVLKMNAMGDSLVDLFGQTKVTV